MKLKTILASTLLGTAGLVGTAQAAIETSTNNGLDNAGGSELLLSVTDGLNTYNRDLGIAFYGIDAGSSFSFSADALLADFLNNAAGEVQWNIVASDADQGSAFPGSTDINDWGTRLLATSTSGNSIFQQAVASNRVNGQIAAANLVGDIISTSNTNPGHPGLGTDPAGIALNGSADVSGTSAEWSQKFNTGGIGASTSSVVGGLDDTLAFYLYGFTGDIVTSPFGNVVDPASRDIFADLLGSWTFDSAGTLTFAGASAVPVPAAVWLFGSALLGLVGVSRRKVAA